MEEFFKVVAYNKKTIIGCIHGTFTFSLGVMVKVRVVRMVNGYNRSV